MESDGLKLKSKELARRNDGLLEEKYCLKEARAPKELVLGFPPQYPGRPRCRYQIKDEAK